MHKDLVAGTASRHGNPLGSVPLRLMIQRMLLGHRSRRRKRWRGRAAAHGAGACSGGRQQRLWPGLLQNALHKARAGLKGDMLQGGVIPARARTRLAAWLR